jgi:hypothetical protein
MTQVNTWTWTINSMYTLPNVPNQPNYVVNVIWTLTGTDGTQTASIDGNTQFAVEATQPNFVPYNQLTQATVIGWIQESLGAQGIANYEANVQGQINSLENPPVSPSSQPLPWAN